MTICTKVNTGKVAKNSQARRGPNAKASASGFAGNPSSCSYNKRHKRHGHLFQNRYKSIVCDEDTYFIELVRYIHLNPLRAGLVDTLAKLDCYRWCGHSAVMGRRNNAWQDCDYVLGWFSSSKKEARRVCRQFVQSTDSLQKSGKRKRWRQPRRPVTKRVYPLKH